MPHAMLFQVPWYLNMQKITDRMTSDRVKTSAKLVQWSFKTVVTVCLLYQRGRRTCYFLMDYLPLDRFYLINNLPLCGFEMYVKFPSYLMGCIIIVILQQYNQGASKWCSQVNQLLQEHTKRWFLGNTLFSKRNEILISRFFLVTLGHVHQVKCS